MAQFDLRRVLCPVDFSRHSAVALKMAGALAKTLGAELTCSTRSTSRRRSTLQ
jgi:hypothetical protein